MEESEASRSAVSDAKVCWLFCFSQEVLVRILGVSMAEPQKGISIIYFS